ncbi:unnamed protein product [Orchesella dallaii]|uniref:RNA-binding protein 5 n=1 Tax=Orchesella dallaii TaxID=48710 RepID=A0ABP1RC78_9HEXA
MEEHMPCAEQIASKGKNSKSSSGSGSDSSEHLRKSSRWSKSNSRHRRGHHSRSRSRSRSRNKRSHPGGYSSRGGESYDNRVKNRSKSKSSRSSRKAARDSRSRSSSASSEVSYKDDRDKHRKRGKCYDRDNNKDWKKSFRYKRQDSDNVKYEERSRNETEPPNNTVMIRGLPKDFTTEEMQLYFVKTGVRIKDFRIPRFHDTNEGRGFAFIEFETIADAVKWKDLHGDTILIRDHIHASLCYSRSTSVSVPAVDVSKDWICKVCQTLNFSYREQCFKCGQQKMVESAYNVCSDSGTVDTNPTSVIALSNLDTLTTENRILEFLQGIPKAASLSLKKLTIEKDAFNISTGVCLIKMHSVHESNILMKVLASLDLVIDGRQVLATFWKKLKSNNSVSTLGNTTSTTASIVAASALEAAKWTNNSSNPFTYTINDVEIFAKQYASAYCKSTSGNDNDYNRYFIYYHQYFMRELVNQQDCLQTTGFIGPQLQTGFSDAEVSINSNQEVLKPTSNAIKNTEILVKKSVKNKNRNHKGNRLCGTASAVKSKPIPNSTSSMPFWMPAMPATEHAVLLESIRTFTVKRINEIQVGSSCKLEVETGYDQNSTTLSKVPKDLKMPRYDTLVMHSRPIRPPPSRKSAFISGIPAVILSQTPADFKPPADYVGPGGAYMEKPPDPSMNPKRLSLPIVSVTKLNVATKLNDAPKTAFPELKYKSLHSSIATFGHSSRKLLESQQAKRILRNMPTVFRKQFASELKNKKRPMRGSNKKFKHYDYHSGSFHEPPTLHGVLLLGGDHRDMVEEAPQDPGTPPPLSGRQHCVSQTDIWLEDVADYEIEFKTTEMQCDAIYDEPLQPTELQFENQKQASSETQLDEWVFSDLKHAFDQVVVNLTEAVIMEALKQLIEESELESLRKQYEYHQCLKNREMGLLAKYRAAQRKHDERKRYLENNKSWEEDLDRVIGEVGFEKIRDIAPLHFIQNRTDHALYEHVRETMVPPINEQATRKVDSIKESRDLLDSMLEEVVMMREAEYSGEVYMRDYLRKEGLGGSNPPSELSYGFNDEMGEWLGEGYYDERVRGEDDWRSEMGEGTRFNSRENRGTVRKSEEIDGEDRFSSPPSLLEREKQSDSSGGSAVTDEYEDGDEEPPLK